jgi:hypothetical protein
MITILLVVFAVMATWHLVWENAILPLIRLRLRYKLYALRDRLRLAYSNDPEGISQEVLETVHGFLHTTIRLLPALTFSFVQRASKEIAQDDGLRKRIAKREGVVLECTSTEITEISAQMKRIAGEALFYNSGGWFLFLIPLALVVKLTMQTSQMILNALFIPPQEMQKIMVASHACPR